MSYDSFSSRRPWDGYRSSQSAFKSSMSSSLYSTPRAPPPGRKIPRPFSSSPLPAGSERMDPARAVSANAELMGLRSQEREQLVDLNDRFATYIDKVRRLELQNGALLAELEALRRRQSDPSRLQALYEGRSRSLRAAVDAESGDKARAEAERDYLRRAYEQTKRRLEEEAKRRADAEDDLQGAREEAAGAAVRNCDAEAAAASLCDETAFLKKVFAEEQSELRAQLQVAVVVGADADAEAEAEASRPDLSGALRDIRGQYERLAGKNMRAAEDWYRGKFASVAEAAGRNNEAARAIREETNEYRRLLHSRSSEIEALRNVIDSLNKQQEEVEEAQDKEAAEYQMRISELERDITDAKHEMGHYLREYQDLLNVKMALDIEIAAYRKLLEGEEIRLAYPSFPALN